MKRRLAPLAILLALAAIGLAVFRFRTEATIAPKNAAPRAESTASVRPITSPLPLVSATRPETRPTRSASAHGGEPIFPWVIFSSPWGSRDDQLGREQPTEGNPEGPMSFSVDPRGRVLVLDQVNGRIVRHRPDGTREAAIALDQRGAQDVVSAKDGSTVVLDRLVDKSIAIYDEGGSLRATLPLTGPGIDDAGFVTGVFVDGTDIYVEREHGPLVHVGDTSGKASESRKEIPGRPTRDGRLFINAGITDSAAARIYVSAIERATEAHLFTRELRLQSPVNSLVLLDSDAHGTIYVGAEIERPQNDQAIVVMCLEPTTGAPIGSVELPANTLPEETFRDIVVQDDGTIVLALRSDEGINYQRYECP